MDEAFAFRFSPRPNRAREIRWRTWGPDAFKEAERDGKPLLLAISAVWCHWCHVMDETTYSDPQVIRLVNDHFIPVRVDNDVRPDVNLRYNMGGWPSTALLTAAGEVITGSTYVPPDQMRPLLEQVRTYYEEHREELQDQRLPVELTEPSPTPADPTPEPITTMEQALQKEFDRAYGGVGNTAKFPQPEVWELALARFVNEGQGWMAGMAVRTMDAMAGSALHDEVGGGFFRYSTTREWTMPHFEKMLEDNSRLAVLYLHGYQVLGDEYYRAVATTTLDWIRTTLQQPNGLFGGSQDADETYYRIPPADRANRPAPYVDPTAYAGANGFAVSAMLLGAAVVDERFRAEGLTSLEAIFTELWDPEVGLYHEDREHEVLNWLADLAAVGHACLDAHQLTGDPEHLSRAEQLVAMMERDLGDDGRPGYFDRPAEEDDFGRMAIRQKPVPANAEAARLLFRLARVKGDDLDAERARGLLGSFGEGAMRFALFAAPWGLAYQAMTAPPLDAVVVTDDNPHDGLPFRRAVHQLYSVNTAVRAMDVMDPEAEEAGYDEDTAPALYLCRGTVCSPPIQNPTDVIGAYRALLVQPGGPSGPRLVT